MPGKGVVNYHDPHYIGPSWRLLKAILAVLEAVLKAILGHLRSLGGHLGSLEGPLGGVLGRLVGHPEGLVLKLSEAVGSPTWRER